MSALEAGCLVKMAARSGSIEVFGTVRDMLAEGGKVKRLSETTAPDVHVYSHGLGARYLGTVGLL